MLPRDRFTFHAEAIAASSRRPIKASHPSSATRYSRGRSLFLGNPGSAEQLCLLRGELLVGQHALAVQLCELLELLDRVGGRRGGRLLVGGFRVPLLLVPARVLCAPARSLATAHSVRDGGRGACDHRRAGHPAK